MKRLTPLLRLILAAALLASSRPATTQAQSLSTPLYDMGSPTLTEYYVDPASGDDSNNGLSRSTPKQTVIDIWNNIPSTLTTGVRINLLPGTYGAAHLPNYWELKTGSASAPIILQAADGYGTVNFTRDINMANVSYFYLLNVSIRNQLDDGIGDAFHCEGCTAILLRGNNFDGGTLGTGQSTAHETIKFNQSQYVFIENNNIHGADDNAIDWVAVQHGHVIGNTLYDTQGWCMYAKGGSSYVLIEANTAHDCGEGGITAGQGTGAEFMTSPWIRYEANYIKIVNNVLYNIYGAALGVNGGYDVLVAHNTAYHVGARSHLLEVVFGERTCDGDASACAALRALGGWAPAVVGGDYSQPIGNRNVTIANNLFYNPAGVTSGSQHFAIYSPRTPTASGIPSPQVTDTNLRIEGNVIWNGSPSMPLGIEGGGEGCAPSNPTCNETQLLASNTINSVEPSFVNAASRDFRPTSSLPASAAIADFDPLDTGHNPIPEGDPNNTMVREFSGAAATTRPAGAFVSSNSEIDPPGDVVPNPPTTNAPPTISGMKAKAAKVKKKVSVTLSAVVSDGDGVASVQAVISAGGQTLKTVSLSLRNGRYRAKTSVRTKAKRVSVTLTATDTLGSPASSSRTPRVK